MNTIRSLSLQIFALSIFCFSTMRLPAQNKPVSFKVIGFYTAKSDLAHISFVQEANKWFSEMGKQHHFTYDSTNNWNRLNSKFLSQYQVVIFLDTRPGSLPQRKAFQEYMEQGGAWMGFHFAAFALTPSNFNQDWSWYHNIFIGAANIEVIPGIPLQLSFVWKITITRQQKIYQQLLRPPPVNGTAGKMI